MSLRAFVEKLGRRRSFGAFEKINPIVRAFSPSDWFVVLVLALVMALSLGATLALISMALTTEVPAHGGTYTEGIVGSPRFINPVLAISDSDRDLTALVFSGLMRGEANGTLTTDLASSYTISEDKQTYTFVIKDNAVFHDGMPVTADDVAFTIDAAENPDIKSPRRANWGGIEVVILGPKTVSFTLKSPYAPFLENATIGILPKHLWKNVSAEEFPFSSLNTNPVGSGPFTVASVKLSSSGIPSEYRLKAFDDGIRIPYIKNFILRFYTDSNTLTAAMNRGDVAALHSVAPDSVTGAATLHEAVYGRIFAVFFNQNQKDLFADEGVRQALNIAVDKNALVSTLVSGFGSPVDGPLPPSTISKESLDTRTKDERVAAAESILVKAGWKLGEDGVFEKKVKKETKRMSFSLATGNAPELKRAAELVAEDWRIIVPTRRTDKTTCAAGRRFSIRVIVPWWKE